MRRAPPLQVDHRGKPCAVARDLREPPPVLPIRRADVPLGRTMRRALLLALCLFVAAVSSLSLLIVLVIIGVRGVVGGWVGPMLFWGSLVMCAMFLGARIATVWSRAHWRKAGRAAAARLLAARGQCPACSAWLLSTIRGADGFTVCPNCTAAWKVGNDGDCPGCGYDMRNVPASAGPLSICPECATLSVATASLEHE